MALSTIAIDDEAGHATLESTNTGLQVCMDKESPSHRLSDIEVEITQCQDELTGLSQIIDEVEGELNRVGRA